MLPFQFVSRMLFGNSGGDDAENQLDQQSDAASGLGTASVNCVAWKEEKVRLQLLQKLAPDALAAANVAALRSLAEQCGLAVRRDGAASLRRRLEEFSIRLMWGKTYIPMNVPRNLSSDVVTMRRPTSAKEAFFLMLPEAFWGKMCEFTNDYARVEREMKDFEPVDRREMLAFVAAHLWHGSTDTGKIQL